MDVLDLAQEYKYDPLALLDLAEENGFAFRSINTIITDSIESELRKIIQVALLKRTPETSQDVSPEFRANYLVMLEKFICDYKIFIDTSSLLEDSFKNFANDLLPLLKKNQSKLYIPGSVEIELLKHFKGSNEKLRDNARIALNLLGEVHKIGLLEKRADASDTNFADNVFLRVFTQFRTTNDLLLITQDKGLSEDIENLRNSKSVRNIKSIITRRVNKLGFLRPFGTDHSFTEPSEKIQPFKLVETVNRIDGKLIHIKNYPSDGEFVFCGAKKIKLITEIARGGEGKIFSTDTKYVCKIYHPNKLTQERIEKLKLMVSREIDLDGLCWPIDLVTNIDRQIIGFLMKHASGECIQDLLTPKQVLLEKFPNWNRKNLIEIAISVVSKFEYLHKLNILVGDVNIRNILLSKDGKVSFVDVDSYQIEGYSCPVGTAVFTPVELQNMRFDNVLRNKNNELFSVATLIFMILLPGKPPYSQQGGESIQENIAVANFPYPLGELSNRNAPEGAWRYIWSHLSYKVKSAFYQTFHRSGTNYAPENRIPLNDWYTILSTYRNDLELGYMSDPESLELFPRRYKRTEREPFYECKICGITEVESRFDQQFVMCNECAHTEKEPRWCVACGKRFSITYGDVEFYKSKNYNLPKRCKECRRKFKGFGEAQNDAI